jgi:predicted ATPase
MDLQRELQILNHRRAALDMLFKNGDIGLARYIQLSSQYGSLFEGLRNRLDQSKDNCWS